MYEVVEFVEVFGVATPEERVVGLFPDEVSAVRESRRARREFLDAGRDEYAWWIVRTVGSQRAAFIADSKSDKEFVLDLTTNELVEVD